MMQHSNANAENGPPSQGQSDSGRHLDDAISEHISPPKDQIQLKWTSHQPTIFNIFQDLYNSEHLVDVTLAAEGKYLRAHKIILSACSPYFQELLSLDCSTKHPILFMSPGVKFNELKSILNYMYKGETQIPQENLPSLLRLAEALQIRGLAETKKSSPVPAPAPVPVQVPQSQQQSQYQPNWPTHPTISTGITVRTGIGIKHKTTGSSIQSLNQPLIVTNPNTSSFPSNPLDISTTNSAKRFRVDPIVLVENQNPLQNVEETTILPTTTAYDEAQVYPDVEGQGNAEVEGRFHAHQMFEMEDVQIIEDHEMKVEVDGNVVTGEQLDESNSFTRSQSADGEENCWNILRSGVQQRGHSHTETDFQIPSTSSSYQGQLLNRDTEADFGDGGLETIPEDGGRHNNMNINETRSEKNFECKTCGKYFSRSYNCVRHEQSHGDADIPCPKCSKRFKRDDLLKKHLKAHK